MSESGYRVVPFADQVVGIEWNGSGARAIADLAFGASGDGADRLPDVIFRLGARPDTGMLTLFAGRTCLYRGESQGAAAHLLVQVALDSLVRRIATGLVLHAAVLGRGECGVLLPGATGSGKTMLSAWLLTSRVLEYQSDEACYLADDGSVVASYARPLCFKGPWAEALGLERIDRQHVLRDDIVSLVPPELLGAESRRTSIVPRLIVFPRFCAGGSLELTRLTAARTAMRLIETVANARNLPDHGLARVTALARSVDAYSMTYGGFDQLDPLVQLIDAMS